MKTVLVGIFMALTLSAHAKSVLISAFDAFGRSKSNNSTLVAKKVINELSSEYPNIEFKFCQLQTIYDQATENLMDCYHSMKEKPQFAISIGEGPKDNITLETRSHNLDHDTMGDNNRETRTRDIIVPGKPKNIGSTIFWNKAYCGLTKKEKSKINFSNSPGSFVCNNTTYRMAALNPEIRHGFIHVRSTSRYWNSNKVRNSTNSVKALIRGLIASDMTSFTKYPSNITELRARLKRANKCDKEFYTKLLQQY